MNRTMAGVCVSILTVLVLMTVGCDSGSGSGGADNYSTVATGTGTAADGVVASDLIVDSADTVGGKADTTVKAVIRSNAVLKDADGTPLNGTITLEMEVSDPDSEDTFDGGFTSVDDGVVNTAKTAGFVKIWIMDSEGRTASTIDPPVELEIKIPENTKNPLTDESYQSGDTVEIWQQNFDTATATALYAVGDTLVFNGVTYTLINITEVSSELTVAYLVSAIPGGYTFLVLDLSVLTDSDTGSTGGSV